VRAIWIKPSQQSGWIEYGGCEVEPASNPDRHDTAIISYAGFFAARRSGDAEPHGSDDSDDWRRAHESLEEHFGDGEQFRNARSWSVQEAERLVDENIDRVARIAAVLIKQHRLDDAALIVSLIRG
jgi:hypothetical protein